MKRLKKAALLLITLNILVVGASALELHEIQSGEGIVTTDKNEGYTLSVRNQDGDLVQGYGLDGKWNGLEWVLRESIESGEYNLSLTEEAIDEMSKLNRGGYNLVFKGDGGAKLEKELVKSEVFEGKITDSTGSGIKTEIQLDDISINTDIRGNFRERISQRNFDKMRLSFRTSSGTEPILELEKPQIETSKFLSDYIRSDYIGKPDSTSFSKVGIEPLGLTVIKSGIPNEGARIKAPYPANTDDIVVYECKKWIIEDESCSSSWERVGDQNSNRVAVQYVGGSTGYWRAQVSNIDTVPEKENLIFSGIMVAKESKLQVRDFSVNDSVYRGEKAKIQGRVVDSNGKPASNFKLNVSVKGPESTNYSTETDDEGYFELDKITRRAGEYSIEVTSVSDGKKKLEFEKGGVLDVNLIKSISLEAPTESNIIVSKPEELELNVVNDGQETVKNVELNVSGVDEDYYEEKIMSFDSIASRQTRNAVLGFDVPQIGKEELTLDVEVAAESLDGETLSDSMEWTINLEYMAGMNPNVVAGKESEEDDTGESNLLTGKFDVDTSMDSLTGSFTVNRTNYNILMGLLALTFLSLSALVKVRNPSGEGKAVREGSAITESEEVHSSSSSNFVCDETGKEFDTKEGLELHKELNGIEG